MSNESKPVAAVVKPRGRKAGQLTVSHTVVAACAAAMAFIAKGVKVDPLALREKILGTVNKVVPEGMTPATLSVPQMLVKLKERLSESQLAAIAKIVKERPKLADFLVVEDAEVENDEGEKVQIKRLKFDALNLAAAPRQDRGVAALEDMFDELLADESDESDESGDSENS